MIWQTFDVNKLGKIWLPTGLRKAGIEALIGVFIAPINTLYLKTLYQMQHDSRVIYLEKLLNETYEISGYDKNNHTDTRQIYIEDTPAIERMYIFQKEELKPLFLNDYVYLDVSPIVYYSFIVWVPETLVFDNKKMSRLIDYYRLAGKKFEIKTY